MSDDFQDHEARKTAALALQKIEAHEKFCEERARKSEVFESEMRVGMKEIAGQFRDGIGRIHARLDDFQKKGFWAAVTVVTTAGLGTLMWLIQQQAN